jgi:hypothetical protein
MKRLLHTIVVLTILASPVSAQNAPVIVELYTSQGCSSCPPADEMMQVLADRDDVIPLSLHVDYWDYIGWKDEFAAPQNAERQRAYAAHAGRRSVYTPEMIINGVTDIVGAKPMEVSMAIAKHKEMPSPVQVDLTRSGDTVAIHARSRVGATGPTTVQMLRYVPAREARITRGENSGRSLTYINVTQNWQVLGQWDGQDPLVMQVQAPGGEPVVVIVQAVGPGAILGAARLR